MNDTSPPFTYPNPHQSDSSEQKKTPRDSVDVSADTIYAHAAEEESDRRSLIKLTVTLLITLFVVGTGVGFFVFNDDENVMNDKPVPTKEAIGSYFVHAHEGIILKTEDGAELIVPEGALEKDAHIEIRRVARGHLTDRYKLTPDGMVFLKPVTVRIPYNENILQNARTVRLNVWNDMKSHMPVSYIIDTTQKKLETTLMEF